MVKNMKRTVRAGVVTLGAALLMMTASPAAQAALHRDDGDDPGSGLSVLETLSYFVGLPILLYAVIAGLAIMGEKKAPASRATPGEGDSKSGAKETSTVH